VHVGQIVEWTVTGTLTHTITFESTNATCLSDPLLEPGSTWEVKFTQAGTYDYKCTLHPGMMGTVTVSP
jgi:plastocyanin